MSHDIGGARRPLVSIVVPVYNGADHLAEALDSLLRQTYPHCEVVVVDDGSTDGTAEVLAGYGAQVRVMRQQNAGQSAALNAGWAATTGEVLSYLSADDRLHPGAVQAAVNALAAAPEALAVYGDYHIIDPASQPLRVVDAPEFCYADMVGQGTCAPGAGVFIRRSAHARVGGWSPDLRQMPDLDYWLRLARHGAVVHLPVVLADHREHEASASFRPADAVRADEPVHIYARYFADPSLPDHLRALRRSGMAHAFLLSARAHLRARRWRTWATRLLQALGRSPAAVCSVRSLRLMASGLIGQRLHVRRWTRQ